MHSDARRRCFSLHSRGVNNKMNNKQVYAGQVVYIVHCDKKPMAIPNILDNKCDTTFNWMYY